MMKADPRLTPAVFAVVLRDALERHRVSARDLAHKCKVPSSEVQEWLEAARLPEPRNFGRCALVLPSLRHLKYQIALEHEQAQRALPAKRTMGMTSATILFADVPALPLPVELPTQFHEAVRVLRERDELTQIELAELVGVTGQAWGQWEAGDAVPVEEHYQALLDLWPELGDVARPPTQPIPKPDGGRGEARGQPKIHPRDVRVAVLDLAPASHRHPAPTAPKEEAMEQKSMTEMMPVLKAAVALELKLNESGSLKEVRPLIVALLRACETAGVGVGDVRKLLEPAK